MEKVPLQDRGYQWLWRGVPWNTGAQREEELDVTASPKALPLRHLVDDLWNKQVSRSRIVLEVHPHQ